MKKFAPVSLLLVWGFISPTSAFRQLDPHAATPPVANKVPRSSTIHGDTLLDNYFWLREKKNPEVIAYLNAENAYTAQVMKGTEPFQEKLFQEMLGRVKETDLTVPYRENGWFYYSRTEKGKQYPIRCRKRGSLDAKEEIILDLNALATGNKFLGLASFEISDDGNLLAYSIDVTGFREYTLHVKDLRTGRDLSDHVAKISSAAWAADNKTLFYVTDDAAKRPYRCYRHVLGNPQDDLVYEEKDELYRITVNRSHDRACLFLGSKSATTSEVRCLASDHPTAAWRVILPRELDHEYFVDHRHGLFYIRSNKGAKNFRLVIAPADDPRPKNWKEMIPHRPDVLLEGIDLFATHCVVFEREQGLQQMRIFNLENEQVHSIEFPEPAYSVGAGANPEFDTKVFRFRYQSLMTPDSVFDYDMDTRKRTLRKQTNVKGYQPSQYASERIFAVAADGARIPIALVYKKGAKRDGTAPLHLGGYGSYGFSIPDAFSPTRLCMLDRGVVYAMAHIRGGSEMGRAWHDQGKMMAKRNTFTDFIAAADHLIAQHFTSASRLVIQGGSAGGLLIGAVVNMRPDLCNVAVLNVPFVDVINTMLDASLPLTIQEYLEWGNPNVKSEYDYMKTYCPYSNVTAKDYPIILVTTSLNDSQVMYWEPAKYVAKLRATKTDNNVLLFKINMAGGHGGASGRYDALKDAAFTAAFILNNLGITQ